MKGFLGIKGDRNVQRDSDKKHCRAEEGDVDDIFVLHFLSQKNFLKRFFFKILNSVSCQTFLLRETLLDHVGRGGRKERGDSDHTSTSHVIVTEIEVVVVEHGNMFQDTIK